ncbi:hypothetical protein [Nonomuraea dietziae]|uniref:hypothetical protein n=1 Tax=Nonomuraea dietziae TaxID=65515 RepID=UPI0033D6F2E7
MVSETGQRFAFGGLALEARQAARVGVAEVGHGLDERGVELDVVPVLAPQLVLAHLPGQLFEMVEPLAGGGRHGRLDVFHRGGDDTGLHTSLDAGFADHLAHRLGAQDAGGDVAVQAGLRGAQVHSEFDLGF